MKLRATQSASIAIAIACTVLSACTGPANRPVARAGDQTTSGQFVVNDNSIETLVRLGDFTMSRGDLPGAIALYRRAHTAAPDRALPLEKLGMALARLGSHDEAAGAYRALLAIDPANTGALRGLGNAYIALNEPELAYPNLEVAVDLEDHPSSYSSLGVALDLLGRHSEAQDAYLAALEEAPADLDIATNLAISLSLSGKHDEAIQLMRQTASAPTASIRHRQNLALVYGLASRIEDARAVARLDLNESAVQRNMGYYAMLTRIEDSRRRAAAIGDSSGSSLSP